MGWAGCLKKKGYTSGAFERAGGARSQSFMETPRGVLTESMTRLRDEILASRHRRQILRSDLAEWAQANRNRVSALRLLLARDRAGARRAWCGSDTSGPTQKKP